MIGVFRSDRLLLSSLQPSFDLSRDKTSPERSAASPKTSPGEEAAADQRSLNQSEPAIREEEEEEEHVMGEETVAGNSPPASARAGADAAADPASRGLTLTVGF